MSSNNGTPIYVPFDVVYGPGGIPTKRFKKKMIWVVGQGYVPEEDLLGKRPRNKVVQSVVSLASSFRSLFAIGLVNDFTLQHKK
jgi:hypothetical protein